MSNQINYFDKAVLDICSKINLVILVSPVSHITTTQVICSHPHRKPNDPLNLHIIFENTILDNTHISFKLTGFGQSNRPSSHLIFTKNHSQ